MPRLNSPAGVEIVRLTVAKFSAVLNGANLKSRRRETMFVARPGMGEGFADLGGKDLGASGAT